MIRALAPKNVHVFDQLTVGYKIHTPFEQILQLQLASASCKPAGICHLLSPTCPNSVGCLLYKPKVFLGPPSHLLQPRMWFSLRTGIVSILMHISKTLLNSWIKFDLPVSIPFQIRRGTSSLMPFSRRGCNHHSFWKEECASWCLDINTSWTRSGCDLQ